jgi:hypothetical protein
LQAFGSRIAVCISVLIQINVLAHLVQAVIERGTTETMLSVDLILIHVVVDPQVEVANTVKKLFFDTPSRSGGHGLDADTRHVVVQSLADILLVVF